MVDRLSKTAQNELINTVTIFLGLAVGSLSATFLTVETLGIGAWGWGVWYSTAAGVLMAKLMSKLSGGGINPLIGAAGVSAVPMAARVVNKVTEANPHNFLLMHAMGPNVAYVQVVRCRRYSFGSGWLERTNALLYKGQFICPFFISLLLFKKRFSRVCFL